MRVILTGGGTGGHVYPALSIGEVIPSAFPGQQHEFLYIGVRGRIEAAVVPRRGMPLKFVRAVGYPGMGNPAKAAHFVGNLAAGTARALQLLRSFRPDLIIATGGYVSAPTVLAQVMLRRLGLSHARTFLHEQNAVPGQLNRRFGRFADVIGITFNETRAAFPRNKTVRVGYPVRDTIGQADREQARCERGINPGDLMVLVFGGSLGSRSINHGLISALPAILEHPQIKVLHATGNTVLPDYHSIEDSQRRFEALGLAPERASRYCAVDYLHEIDKDYAAADLVVCRAGAGTLYEIARCGLPGVIIPRAGLPADHQVVNARAFQLASGAEVIYETVERGGQTVNSETLAETVVRLAENPGLRASIGQAARQFAGFSARQRIAQVLQALMAGNMSQVATELNSSDGNGNHHREDRFTIAGYDGLIRRLERLGAPGGLAGIPQADLHFLHYRTDVYLASADWQARNAGVKLAGLTNYHERIPRLMALLDDSRGFIRRNVFKALEQIDTAAPPVPDMIRRGLQDSYFEVRAWAAGTVTQLAPRLPDSGAFIPLLERLARERNFEVRQAALIALASLTVDGERLLPLLRENYYHPNCRIREAVISILGLLCQRGALPADTVRSELNQILITSNDFLPHFELKRRLSELDSVLRAKR